MSTKTVIISAERSVKRIAMLVVSAAFAKEHLNKNILSAN
jgi:hypothetical protein